MQLENSSIGPAGIRRKLIAASCALLSTSGAKAQSFADFAPARLLKDWQLQSALAYYHEDGRIQAVEPLVVASREYDDGSSIGLNFTFDSLSGSSPNGALPSRVPQTFASPSARNATSVRHSYTTPAGALPADPNYSDARVAFGADWTVGLARLLRGTLGGRFSYEDDFYSASVSAGLERDFNEKNTTVSLTLNDENDFLQPIGGAPVPFSDYSLFEKSGHKTKNGAGVLLSATQVMTRGWLTQFNLAVDRFSGYLNDPYKIVSVLDAGGVPIGYRYESRPGSRVRKSVYLDNRFAWTRTSAGLSLRYMTDTWGIHSDTAQVRLRWWGSGRDFYFEPSVRWYRQTAADFYRGWLPATSATGPPSYVSSDSRLGAFHALTFGLKYGMQVRGWLGRDGSEASIRLEYYEQTNRESATPFAGLQGLDLYPNLKAILLQVGFDY